MSFLQSFQNTTDYSITRGFSPQILFRGFLLPTRWQIKHNILRRLLYLRVRYSCAGARKKRAKNQLPIPIPPLPRDGTAVSTWGERPSNRQGCFLKVVLFSLHERPTRYDSVLNLGLRKTYYGTRPLPSAKTLLCGMLTNAENKFLVPEWGYSRLWHRFVVPGRQST